MTTLPPTPQVTPPGSAWINPQRALFVAVPVIALLLIAHVVATVFQVIDYFRWQLIVMVAEGGIYALAIWLTLTGRMVVGTTVIVAVGIFMRLCLLFMEPTFSSDIYRYIWDGRVQGGGINPYRYIPNDGALAFLRDPDIWPKINRADYAPTIYPPGAEILFYLATRFSESILAMKTALFALELASMFVINRLLRAVDLPASHLMIYAWSPLVVWEFSSNGHIDAAMITFTLLAFLFYRNGRMIGAGVALAFAVLMKFFPMAIAPALYRWGRWRVPLACIATIIAGYLLYSSAGLKVFGFLQQYLVEEGIRDGDGFWLTQTMTRLTGLSIPRNVYLGLAAVILAALALRVQFAEETPMSPLRHGFALAVVATVVVSPVYPWYFCWLVAFAVFVPSPAVLWLAITAPLLNWGPPRQIFWMGDVAYGGMFAIALAQLLFWLMRQRGSAKNHKSA